MKRSKFNLSNYKLLSCNMGDLVPIGLHEVLPGDSFKHSTSALLRVSPLLSPVMHPVEVRVHHWFVPFRIIWEDFEKFITGGEDGMDASVFPTVDSGGTGFALGSLADYLGVPPSVVNLEVSALPFRAYALIWNEFYRDQDLQTKLVIDKTSGADTTTSLVMKKCAWEKDYFTSSRPWEQKGPDVTVPIGGMADVVLKSSANDPLIVKNATNHTLFAGLTNFTSGAVNAELLTNPSGVPATLDPNGNWEADLSSATSASINELREAFAIQRFQERMSRHGSRYVEYLRSQGVISSDARLQLPEYLGGGKETIQFSEVVQTGVDSSGEGVGSLYGHGIAGVKSNKYIKFFEEHGYVITLMSVKPKTIYAQGLPKTWNRRTKFDFFQPELQHIGQQAVLNKEVYAASASPNDTFGYQDRYDEYRRTESTIAGDFRTTLDFWHFARIFGSPPTLNGSFVECTPDDRPFAVPSEDVLWIMANHRLKARRSLAKFGKSYIY